MIVFSRRGFFGGASWVTWASLIAWVAIFMLLDQCFGGLP